MCENKYKGKEKSNSELKGNVEEPLRCAVGHYVRITYVSTAAEEDVSRSLNMYSSKYVFR